jgi:predicted nucleic acid-binding protein
MSAEPVRFVLDSFALLAFLESEPGMARVKEVLKEAEKGHAQVYLSWINLGEVLYITEREQGQQKARQTMGYILALPIQMLEIPPLSVVRAAHIKATHRLSYADAFAVVAALDEDAILLTADPEFKSVESMVVVEWLEK